MIDLTEQTDVSPVMAQVGMLNLRIGDMMSQLNVVMKALLDENAALRKENAELKAKQGLEK